MSKHFGFYCTYLNDDRFCFYRFDGDIDKARAFLDIIIAGDTYKWDTFAPAKGITPEPMIVLSRGITIRGPGLEDAMEHTPGRVDFPTNELAAYMRFARERSAEPVEPLPPSTDDNPPAPRPTRPVRAPKPDKTGLVTVATIAQSLKCDPKHARAALRKAGVAKPDAGWAWPSDLVPSITNTIKENLK